MIKKNYIRSLLVVGGSIMISLPPAFIRRKKLAHGIKILLQDNIDTITIKLLSEETLKEIDIDNKQRFNLSENKRLKIISKTYRQEKINNKKVESPKWKKVKRNKLLQQK